MSAINKWFPERAFGENADSRLIIPLQSQQKAIAYLCSLMKDPYGARMLIGEASSGKSTIVRGFLSVLRSDIVVAEVDGTDQNAEEFLVAILDQFGYNTDLKAADELLRMVSVFAVQQTRTLQPPLVVVENLEKMQPAALRALCVLANVTYQGKYAVRLVVTGTSTAQALLGSKGMAGEDIVTMAWGIRVPFRNGISTGVSYERVLSQRQDIFEQRFTAMVSYTF